ncbi:MAG: hypothetical protein ACKOX6_05560 [Bdellovibrio sp.]
MKVFLSSLGMMGRRHLLGALQAGAEVHAFDPSEKSIEAAKEAVQKATSITGTVIYQTKQPQGGSFDVAIFSETADYRKANFEQFVADNKAKRVLLEKPVTTGWADFEAVMQKASAQVGTEFFVNFPRRTWPFYTKLKEQIGKEELIELTLNGGAVGLGCNGIHYIDMFLYLTSHISAPVEVAYSKISSELVGSGRGPRFKDYGGHFLLKKGPASFFMSMNPSSTATPIITFKTPHGNMWIDENNYTFRQWNKTAGFEKPNYLYGQDYVVTDEGNVAYRDLISLTKLWVQGEIQLPRLADVEMSHKALFDLLSVGGAQEPYLFT